MSPHSRRQAVLPTRHSGLGLRESARPFCHVVRLQRIAISIRWHRAALRPNFVISITARSRHQHLRVGLPPSAHQAWLWASDQASLNSCAFHPDFCTLRWWTEQIYKAGQGGFARPVVRARPCPIRLSEPTQPGVVECACCAAAKAVSSDATKLLRSNCGTCAQRRASMPLAKYQGKVQGSVIAR